MGGGFSLLHITLVMTLLQAKLFDSNSLPDLICGETQVFFRCFFGDFRGGGLCVISFDLVWNHSK
jgi:hypothetical protein